MKHKSLLRHLDSPVRILSFSIPELMGYITPFLVGSLFDSILIVPLSGLLVVFALRKIIRKFPRFHLVRVLYWALPTAHYNKLFRFQFPSSCKRLWLK